MEDSSLPPVKRRPVPVPPPPPDAARGETISPQHGAPPIAAAPNDSGIALDRPAAATVASVLGSVHGHAHRRNDFPRWAWFSLAGGGLLTVVGFVLFLLYGQPEREKPTEGTPLAKLLAKTHDAKTDESPAKSVQKTPADEKTAADKTGRTSPEPARKPPEAESKTPDESEPSKPKPAKSLEEAKEALVRFEGPAIGAERATSGLGFLIDGRGWIATNLSAVEDATTATRAVLADGQRCPLAGIVAKDDQHGLAIVKLRELPKRMTFLDIAATSGPQAGDRLFLVGHPYRADFIFTPATVAAVLKTAELPQSVRRPVAGVYAPRDASWIQHTAKTSALASGCPLLNEDGKVLGVNRLNGGPDEHGYAIPVRYLRTLAETGAEAVTPLPKGAGDNDLADQPRRKPQEPDLTEPVPVEPEPPGPEPVAPDERVELSRPRMKELYETAVAAGWKPQRAAQYAAMADLARLLTFAKSQKDQAGARVNLLPQDIQDALQYADEVSQTLRKTEFDADQIRAINRFAVDQVEKPNAGAMLFANVLQIVREGQQGKDALIAEVAGTQKLVGVFLPADAPLTPGGARLLILGVVRPQAAELQDQAGKKQRISLLHANYLLPVK